MYTYIPQYILSLHCEFFILAYIDMPRKWIGHIVDDDLTSVALLLLMQLIICIFL